MIKRFMTWITLMSNCHQHQRRAVGRVSQAFRKTFTLAWGPGAVKPAISSKQHSLGVHRQLPFLPRPQHNSRETVSAYSRMSLLGLWKKHRKLFKMQTVGPETAENTVTTTVNHTKTSPVFQLARISLSPSNYLPDLERFPKLWTLPHKAKSHMLAWFLILWVKSKNSLESCITCCLKLPDITPNYQFNSSLQPRQGFLLLKVSRRSGDLVIPVPWDSIGLLLTGVEVGRGRERVGRSFSSLSIMGISHFKRMSCPPPTYYSHNAQFSSRTAGVVPEPPPRLLPRVHQPHEMKALCITSKLPC